jgi:glycosyltransferase involved in cell wall biosynthesis
MPRRTNQRLRIALVGTRGVPARYGGFETAVEEVGRRLVEQGHEVVVYCRTTSGGPRPERHLGMRLVHLPALRRRSLETLSHTGASVAHLMVHRVDAAIVFNAANAPWLPLLRAARIPVATHVDGLEWQRAKWGGIGKRYYRVVEALSVRWSDALIADAQGIADYYRAEFAAPTEQIAYGAPETTGIGGDRLGELGLTARGYHLVVARFEPENHVDVIVDGYWRSQARLPLVVVGSAPYADDYTRRVHALADERVRFLGGVWDQELLDQLYANSHTYLHGHSVGGTNPSLLRAIGAGAATIAYDVSFNREVLESSGRYFTTAEDVSAAVMAAELDPEGTRRDGRSARLLAARYDWDDVADRYAALCRRLAARDFPRTRPSGRRLRLGPAAQPELRSGVRTATPVLAPVPRSPLVEPVRAPLRLAVAEPALAPVAADPVAVEVPPARTARS